VVTGVHVRGEQPQAATTASKLEAPPHQTLCSIGRCFILCSFFSLFFWLLAKRLSADPLSVFQGLATAPVWSTASRKRPQFSTATRDDVSEMGKKILKALEKKDAENLDLRFAQVITKIDTTTEAHITKIDTTTEALITKIEKIDRTTEALVTKIDTLYVGVVAILCLTLSDKILSLIAAFLKQ
jgi:hypothetical protein